MKRFIVASKKRKGVALIVSLGILTLLTMIATGFALAMQLEYKAASNYLNYTDAAAIADAGMDKAIADIRNWVKTVGYNTVVSNISTNYPPSNTVETALGDGTYSVAIESHGDKINLNALDEADDPWLQTLNSYGLTDDDIARIIDYRDSDTSFTTEVLRGGSGHSTTGNETGVKNAPYATLEEVRIVLNDDTKYNAIKDYVTVDAPIIRGGLMAKYYHDPSTFSKDTILDPSYYKGKVIELGNIRQPAFSGGGPWATLPSADGCYADGSDENGWEEAHDAEWAGGYLVTDLPTSFTRLQRFGVMFTGFIYIPEDWVNQNVTFKVVSDDGHKIYIDNTVLINNWGPHNTGEKFSASRTFTSAGWHPIRIDYYQELGSKGLEITWVSPITSIEDYIPAESYGYYAPSYYGSWPNPSSSPYNSAGLYKITSTGRVKAGTTVLSTKKVTAFVRVFGTWTQTARSEFYAPWFTLASNFSDGELKNVNWMDSCPTEGDYWDAANSKMRWEEGYAIVKDSLKLGYWDNFDEDVAYSQVMLHGDAIGEIISCTYKPNPAPGTMTQNWAAYATWFVSYNANKKYGGAVYHQPFRNVAGETGYNKFVIEAPVRQDIKARLNEQYYTSDSTSGNDAFIRAWEKDRDTPSTRAAGGGLPEIKWMVGGLYLKGPCHPWMPVGAEPWKYYTVLMDGFAAVTGNDESNLWIEPPTTHIPLGFDYSQAKVMAIGSIPPNNQAFIDGVVADNTAGWNPPPQTGTPVPKLNGINCWAASLTDANYTQYIAQAIYCGANSDTEVYWDRVRFIPKIGWFVSTPYRENYNLGWGTISWNSAAVGGTNIAMYVRAGSSVISSDNFVFSAATSSGSSLSGLANSDRIQYKAILTTNAFSLTDYSSNGVTPILKDVTVTYLPQADVIYRRQEVQ